jgi:hypothetical protein
MVRPMLMGLAGTKYQVLGYRGQVTISRGCRLLAPRAQFVDACHAHPGLRELVNRYQVKWERSAYHERTRRAVLADVNQLDASLG